MVWIIFLVCSLLYGTAALAAIGPEPSRDTPRDFSAPSDVSEVRFVSDGVKLTITWKDPPESDFYRLEILRNKGGDTPVSDVIARIEKGVQRFEDREVVSGQTYLYRFRVMDLLLNTRLSIEYAGVVQVPAASAPTAPTTPTAPTAAPAAATTTTLSYTDPSDLDALLARFSLTRDRVAEEQYAPLIVSDAQTFEVSLTEAERQAAVNFAVYGISSTTIKLGAGERRALARDYFETIGRADIAWADVERLASGVKPAGRNLPREQAQVGLVRETWRAIKGRDPDFSDSSEDLAWNTMMYRVRFPRDLVKEKAGIEKFRAAFARLPKSPLDWSTVRALGYVL